MTPQNTTFLGNNLLTEKVSGCEVALTSYGDSTGFEEWHSHENSGISFLLTGTHEEDLFGKKHKRVPGNIKFIPAGEMHRCNNYTSGTRKINLDLSAELYKAIEISENNIPALLEDSRQIKFNLLKLYHEVTDQGNHVTASAQLLLYNLFTQDINTKNSFEKELPGWVNLLRQILHDEWNVAFDLNDLAKKVGVHPVTISRYFPQYFSSTLGIYIRNIKVDKALALIKTSKLSLTAIAYTCGFADQAHFTRTFKSVTGYLPKDYRNI